MNKEPLSSTKNFGTGVAVARHYNNKAPHPNFTGLQADFPSENLGSVQKFAHSESGLTGLLTDSEKKKLEKFLDLESELIKSVGERILPILWDDDVFFTGLVQTLGRDWAEEFYRAWERRKKLIAFLDSCSARKGKKKNEDEEEEEKLKYIDLCEKGKGTIFAYDKFDRRVNYFRYTCNSWRHEGECRRRCNRRDFARIREGLKKYPTWIYIVLTLGKQAREEGELWEIYKNLYDKWDRLRKRLIREYGQIQYIALVEQHRDGMPHINIVLHNDEIYKACEGEGWKEWRGNWLEENATAVGFGFRTWVEPVRRQEAIASYFVKLIGEIAKVNQVPVSAPKGFRRLRASQGLLPKRVPKYDGGGLLLGKVERFLFHSKRFGAKELDQTEDSAKIFFGKALDKVATSGYSKVGRMAT